MVTLLLVWVNYVLQIWNQLHFFTQNQDFLHGQCKKYTPEVKNLPVAFLVGISTFLDRKKNEVPESCLLLSIM